MLLHVKALVFEIRSDLGVGFVLLISDFGVVVKPQAQVFQRVGVRQDLDPGCLLRLVDSARLYTRKRLE
jgi:hypothetical protein